MVMVVLYIDVAPTRTLRTVPCMPSIQCHTKLYYTVPRYNAGACPHDYTRGRPPKREQIEQIANKKREPGPCLVSKSENFSEL